VDVAGVVLAAGAGTRLLPLTRYRPKPLCPVAGVALLDRALARVRTVAADVAVNVHHGRTAMEAHLAGAGVHVSIEEEQALGTAGALAHLRPWIDGRPVLVVNGDTWSETPLAPILDGWDGERPRLLVIGRWPTPRPRLVGALLPWNDVARLAPVPSGLWEAAWRADLDAGRIDVVSGRGPFVDCGTPAAYLAANLAATGGAGFVDPRAAVGEGARLDATVVWDDGDVRPGERLFRAIRYAGGRTVLIR
jgi:MurNAc alpha-1-phosphate uridylyltransferase